MDRAYQEPRPSRQKPFPLVMFSPGLWGPAWEYLYIPPRLASHGFVVALITHYGETALWWDPDVRHLATAAADRPRDVSFALTKILERNRAHGDLLHGLVRPDRIAAAGHSYGGYAAMTLAGGDDSVCDVFQTARSPAFVLWLLRGDAPPRADRVPPVRPSTYGFPPGNVKTPTSSPGPWCTA